MPILLRVDREHPDSRVVQQAADAIRDGLVVAYPTDTLYGLAVDPRNPAAVRRLFALKGRAESSALTLIAADAGQAGEVARLGTEAQRLATRWWPGPLTIVLDARAGLAPETLAGGHTVGVRVPDHPVARSLARLAGFCVTATSANRSGEAAAFNAAGVEGSLAGVDLILDAGDSPGGSPSTIVDASGAGITLLRDGALPWDRVLNFLSSGA